jgi:hypothetical protein
LGAPDTLSGAGVKDLEVIIVVVEVDEGEVLVGQ